MQHKERLQRFVEKMWRWYDRNKRTLPWRDLQIADDTERAYMILVSEVMLQQTQVLRVRVVFKQFIERFPTIEHLAKASNREVLIAWRGMGYNSRALRLRDAARVIVGRCRVTPSVVEERRGQCQHDGSGFDYAQPDTHTIARCLNPRDRCCFPKEMSDLLSIPGIGPYTAAAIRNFAFGIPTPCVDVNIERILARVFGLKAKKRVEEEAMGMLRVALDVKNWHSALMDFGSAVCTKRSPKCIQCPLSHGICRSAFTVDRANEQRATHKREPGRQVGGRFIPNRIFRGKVVDLLRDHPQGLTLESIGREICLDWSREHRPWLCSLVEKLRVELCILRRRQKYVLGD